jgi:hypothetical protein
MSTRDIDIEKFVFGDEESISHLTPNGPDEEISPRSYLRFMQRYLTVMGGFLDQSDLDWEIERHFEKIWGPADRRLIHGRPKWKNSLDWAKVMGRKLTPPILSRTKKLSKGKFTAIVLITPETDPEWLEFVTEIKPRKGFKKKCKQCQNKVSLSTKRCRLCGYEFPAVAARKHKLPE